MRPGWTSAGWVLAVLAGALVPVAAQGQVWSLDFEQVLRVIDDPVRQVASFEGPRPPVAGPLPSIQYEGGDAVQRWARVVPDPARPDNHVLETAVQEANVRIGGRDGFKSRVQMNLYQLAGASELYVTVRLRLDGSMKALLSAPRFDWFTISEWWNNAGWTREPYPFRISVDLTNAGGGDGLGLLVRATAKPEGVERWSRTVWSRDGGSFRMPFDTWVRLEYLYREGGPGQGRFAMAVTVEGRPRVVVLDVADVTHHPDDPRPDGLAHLNPAKLYTSRQVTEAARAGGGALRLWWDDLVVQACSPGPQAGACGARFAAGR